MICSFIEDVAFCTSRADGIYKDPDNCHAYIWCTSGREQRGACQGNLVFDKTRRACVDPSIVPCQSSGGSKGMILICKVSNAPILQNDASLVRTKIARRPRFEGFFWNLRSEIVCRLAFQEGFA